MASTPAILWRLPMVPMAILTQETDQCDEHIPTIRLNRTVDRPLDPAPVDLRHPFRP